MKIRLAEFKDLPEIIPIYEQARAFMASYGNSDQWGTIHPRTELLEEDIRLNRLYVCTKKVCSNTCEKDQIALVFMLLPEKDPNYDIIIDGSWPDDRPYKTIHRVASTRKVKGAADFVFAWCEEECRKAGCNFRGDTHEKNLPMQRVFERNGFRRCGVVFMQDGTPRYAYQKTLINK